MSTRKSTTNSQYSFSQAPTVGVPRSTFDRSHGVKTTFDAGLLVPILVDEILPGDSVDMNFTHFTRLATPIFPIMDNIWLDFWVFFVPNRLVWENWASFMGEHYIDGSPTEHEVPFINAPAGGFPELSVYDYMGVPTQVENLEINALPLRAYNLIFAEWFRAQDLQGTGTINRDDGPDPWNDYIVKGRNKRHDYFSSCLPWPLKGGTEVTLPLGTSAPVSITADPTQNSGVPQFQVAGGNVIGFNATSGNTTPTYNSDPGATGALGWGPLTALEGTADLSSATASTINNMREAITLQQFLERDARSGTRYQEVIYGHFKVVSPDARHNRPEVICMGTKPVGITQVPQTSESVSGGNTPQGNLAAYGTSVGNPMKCSASFTEHGYLIGLVSARADLNYQQGLEKHWSRKAREEYFWPTFAHLGEQSVLNQELEALGTPDDGLVFGYQERYAEYRHKPGRVTARMRSNSTLSLDRWHLAQDFMGTQPALNTFIVEMPPIDRVIAVQDEPHFIMDGFFNYKHTRPMPTYSVPGLTRF